MCAVFGYLDYKGKISNAVLKKLIRNLSIAAEVRGTDATGISYENQGNIVTFKNAKPAHKMKLYFPRNTKAVIGHTRMTTQGSEKYNYNNHPFKGNCEMETFALALIECFERSLFVRNTTCQKQQLKLTAMLLYNCWNTKSS